MKKIFTVIGARPQFVKAAVVSRRLREMPGYGGQFVELLVHTGQHYDHAMSEVFFEEMEIPRPDFHLNLGGGTHGQMTGLMLERIEKLLMEHKPDVVLVYGDTNSTLAGALAAAKVGIPVAHVEAGLRSHNLAMPEEINRKLTDSLSQYLFCPSQASVDNLSREGIPHVALEHGTPCRVINSGDVMQDAVLHYVKKCSSPKIVSTTKPNILLTLHRQENVDHKEKLSSLQRSAQELSKTFNIIFPIHPRTRKRAEEFGLDFSFCAVTQPVGYIELLSILKCVDLVATDSGGLQKEAFFLQKPCLVLREETEWTELLESGNNILCGTDEEQIKSNASKLISQGFIESPDYYGSGNTGEIICQELIRELQEPHERRK